MGFLTATMLSRIIWESITYYNKETREYLKKELKEWLLNEEIEQLENLIEETDDILKSKPEIFEGFIKSNKEIKDIIEKSKERINNNSANIQQNVEKNEGVIIGKNLAPITINNIRETNKKKSLTNLPPRGVNIVGREKELQDMDALIRENKILLLNGIGGMGKTEICKGYLYRNYDRYETIIWIKYDKDIKTSLIEQINLFENQEIKNIDERYNKIIEYLHKIKSNSLFILDNFDNPEDEFLEEILSFHFDVIISSRNIIQDLKAYKITTLDFENCKKIFYFNYRGKQNEHYLEKIINLCGFHTLTLKILSKLSNYLKWTIEETYSNLIDVGFNLDDVFGVEISSDWSLKNKKKFFEHIRKIFNLSDLTEYELYVMNCIAMISSIVIDIDLFKKITDVDFEVINNLICKGWITELEDFEIDIHPMIKEVVLEDDHNKGIELKDFYIKLNDEICLSTKNTKDINLINKIILSTSNLLRNTLDYKKVMITDIHSSLYTSLAMLLLDLGKLDLAKHNIEMGEIVLSEVIEKNNVPMDEVKKQLIILYANKATVYESYGKYNKAIDYFKKAEELIDKENDKEIEGLAVVYNGLGLLYCRQSKYNKGIKYYLDAIEIKRQLDNKFSLITSLNNISQAYMNKDDFDLKKAEEYLKEALEIGENIPDKGIREKYYLTYIYENYGVLFRVQNYLDKAIKYLKKSFNIRNELDNKHYMIVYTLNNMGIAYNTMKKYGRGYRSLKKALDLYREIYNYDTDILPIIYCNLSLSYKGMYEMHNQERYLNISIGYAEKSLEIDKKLNTNISKIRDREIYLNSLKSIKFRQSLV